MSDDAKPCAVSWCGAIATKGEHCAVHAENPDYDPAKPPQDATGGGAGIEPSASPSTNEH